MKKIKELPIYENTQDTLILKKINEIIQELNKKE